MYQVDSFPSHNVGMMHKEKIMKPKYNLQDYIYDVESRSLENEADPEDVYAQLQQKDKDLILAAELGKALLEKNEELSRNTETLAEEYSQKLEEIEQDRHLLRRKLLSTQSECDTRILELQADIRELQNALDERENSLRQTEKEKTLLISELTEQNQRLQKEVKERSKKEDSLTSEVQKLRDQYMSKSYSVHEQLTSIEGLNEEINLLQDKKLELERRLNSIQVDHDNMRTTLEEANDRVMMLERQTREQEIQLRVCKRELDELRSVNGNLGNRLEALGSLGNLGHRSLQSEMECEDSNLSPADELQHMKREVASVCERVKILCLQLKQRSREPFDPARLENLPVTVQQVKVGLLSGVVQELYDMIVDLGSDYSNNSVSVTELEIDLHRANEKIERLTKEVEDKNDEVKRQSESVLELTSRLSVCETELSGAREERDRARSDHQDVGSLAKDQIVKKAWEVRDGAVARKNAVQIELARVRIDLMQTSSQLMEAIQQKVELSQQLEQWQMDLHVLLDENLRRKLTNQEQSSTGEISNSPVSSDKKRSSRRLFSIFQR